MPWPKLALDTTRDGDRVTLAVAGELDLATGSSLEQAALALLADQPGVLVLDLRELAFCDSSGIASLIRIQRATARAGGTLQLHHVDERVRRVLEIGGVSQLLGVVNDEPTKS